MSLKDAASALNAENVVTGYDTSRYRDSLAAQLEQFGFSRELKYSADCIRVCETDNYSGVDLVCPAREGAGSVFLRIAVWDSGPVLYSGKAEFFSSSGILEDAFTEKNIMDVRTYSVSFGAKAKGISQAEQEVVLWILKNARDDIRRRVQPESKLPDANLTGRAPGPTMGPQPE